MHLHVLRQAGHVEPVLNRPECRNALSGALLTELTQTLAELANDRAVRRLIITGTPPAVCAGLHLREVEQAGATFDNAPLVAFLETIEKLPPPVVAAVNGPALAGESVSARRAAEIGLVNGVVADGESMERARQWAARLAALPARTLAETKALFRRLREVRGDETELRRLNALLSRDDKVL